jgi:hypothetical protein
MSLLKENTNENELKELYNFSRTLQQHYYSCRLEKTTNTQVNNSMGWKCAKFSNLTDAEKFITDNTEKTVLTQIIPFKCANPFDIFEVNIVSDKVNFPVEIVNPSK